MTEARCPACGKTNPASQKFCGTCGAAIPTSDSETVISPAPAQAPLDRGHFVPGQMVGDRYRMVALLGRGGMGEVYRAEDLKLGQPVALKFLPRDVEGDANRLQRFLGEVRLALRVTHPNVCRVFDIAETAGRHFISMEFVDGEDLASLLRRIGRLPEDKAVEISRQLCAGLAAAHDQGVLHRDLKPANVMIDGRGRAKITDFGLAGATAGISGREAQAGTPQYMAPEQFDGRELSVQTDLYSLGLVLYELFTGKRAFDGSSMNELKALHSSTPTSPSAHVPGLDPAIERAILRCTDPDPARRPRSASSLAAALPGGDPVAMALAAGETPSPEMVARSGGAGALKPSVAVACLAVVLAGLGLMWTLHQRVDLHNLAPMTKPPAELQVIARGILESAGYPARQPGRAFGFAPDTDYFDHIKKTNPSPTRWDDVATAFPGPVWFWYREAPRTMVPVSAFGSVGMNNPPLTVPGMTSVRLDSMGRLQEFRAVPPDLPAAPGPWAEPDWSPFFKAAGVVQTEWTPAEPKWAAPEATDVRRAWSRDRVAIETGSFRGKPTWFHVVPEWRRPTEVRLNAARDLGAGLVQSAFVLIVFAGGAVIARRNLRQGRGDRRGAFRLAAVYLGAGCIAVLTRLTTSPTQWLNQLQRNFAYELYLACTIWLFYLAVEPYVRRLWPGTLVAWTRLLEGRLRDPLIGRHILLGALSGLTLSLLGLTASIAPFVGGPAGPEPTANFDALTSTAGFIRTIVDVVQHSFLTPVAILVAVLIFRVIFRRPWLAYAVLLGILSLQASLGDVYWVQSVAQMLSFVLILAVVTRLGLFAFLVMIIFSYWYTFPLTTNASSWFFTESIVTMVLFAAIAGYGFWVSLGGQKVVRDSLLE